MPARVLVLHGPNLNLLVDLEDIDAQLDDRARELGLDLKSFQANAEGPLVDALQAERTKVSGIIVNAARLAPTADVLAEALTLVRRPTIEVLLDAGFKARSALKGAVTEQVVGRGADAYLRALEKLGSALSSLASRPTAALDLSKLQSPASTVSDDMAETGPIAKAEVKKTLGRKQAPVAETDTALIKKSLGGRREKPTPDGALSRSMVREKISERLSGKLTPAGLATWARAQWQQIQRGAPVESGQRDRLEDVLQTLLLSASTKANDHQLIELMTQLA
jgi:3-dehydroquinate dehydratase-2